MRKKLRQLFLLLMAAVMMVTSISLTAFADESETDEDAMIPQVFYKDHDNSDVRVIIGTTEEITIGKTRFFRKPFK